MNDNNIISVRIQHWGHPDSFIESISAQSTIASLKLALSKRLYRNREPDINTLDLYRVDERVLDIPPSTSYAQLSITLLQEQLTLLPALDQALLLDSNAIHIISKQRDDPMPIYRYSFTSDSSVETFLNSDTVIAENPIETNVSVASTPKVRFQKLDKPLQWIIIALLGVAVSLLIVFAVLNFKPDPSSQAAPANFSDTPSQQFQVDSNSNCLNVFNSKIGINGSRILTQSLEQGKWYKIEAIGYACYNPTCIIASDARFTTNSNFTNQVKDAVITGGNMVYMGVQSDILSKKAIDERWVNGIARNQFWGNAYSSNHAYSYAFQGSGVPVDLYTVDFNCGKNNGSIAVNLYEQM